MFNFVPSFTALGLSMKISNDLRKGLMKSSVTEKVEESDKEEGDAEDEA